MDAPGTEVSQSFKWYEVWREVFFHPSLQTFLRILTDPMAKRGRAFL